MTDFFDELERELRRAHRRDIQRHARSRGFDRRWLPGLPAVARGTLVALAVVVALIVIVLAFARESDVEQPVAPPPQPSPTAAGPGGCAPWKAPIVDEPIPEEIATRFAIFRDPPPRWQAAAPLPEIPQARKLYRGPVTLRPVLDTGAPTGSRPDHRERLLVVVIAAAISTGRPDPDICAPPPDPIEPGICVASFRPNGKPNGVMCYSIDEIERARAWFGGRTVFGLAPDGAERVIFDTTSGPQSLNVSENVFTGEIRCSPLACSRRYPDNTNTQFAP